MISKPLKRWKIEDLWDYLQDLQDTRASQHTALIEFKYGDYFNPTEDQIIEAMHVTRKGIGSAINDVMSEIERREPGTFITWWK